MLPHIPSEPASRGRRGTNPEELIAAAHAGVLPLALAFGLQDAGCTPTELTTEPR
jgi:lipoyl-dependent peroxiredoxin